MVVYDAWVVILIHGSFDDAVTDAYDPVTEDAVNTFSVVVPLSSNWEDERRNANELKLIINDPARDAFPIICNKLPVDELNTAFDVMFTMVVDPVAALRLPLTINFTLETIVRIFVVDTSNEEAVVH